MHTMLMSTDHSRRMGASGRNATASGQSTTGRRTLPLSSWALPTAGSGWECLACANCLVSPPALIACELNPVAFVAVNQGAYSIVLPMAVNCGLRRWSCLHAILNQHVAYV